MNKANQRMRILKYMKQNGSITGLEATNVLHIMDYRKRISEMRRNGINIDDEWQKKTDGDGMSVRYKRYFLIND
jgi:hypothetical protein